MTALADRLSHLEAKLWRLRSLIGHPEAYTMEISDMAHQVRCMRDDVLRGVSRETMSEETNANF